MPGSRWMTLAVLGITISLGGCHFSSARIKKSTLTDQYDPKTIKPARERTQFPTTQPEIYDIVTFAYCPKGTKVAVVWHYLGGPAGTPSPQQIDRVAKEVRGSGRIAFALTRPNKGWPPGKYAAKIYLNGKLAKTDTFQIQ